MTGHSLALGAQIVQEPCDGTPAQHWIAVVVRSGGVWLSLPNQGSGLCLDPAGESSADHTLIQQGTCTRFAPQLWG